MAGWFSYQQGNATAGDLFAAELVCDWLDDLGYSYEIALTPPFMGGLLLDEVNPKKYSHAIFVCGPFGRDPHTTKAFLD